MQQKTEILTAIEDGARTSQDLVDMTGVERNKVAAYLCKLRHGFITIKGERE